MRARVQCSLVAPLRAEGAALRSNQVIQGKAGKIDSEDFSVPKNY